MSWNPGWEGPLDSFSQVDQIALVLPKTHVREGSSFQLPVYFRYRLGGTLAIPTTVHVRVDCLTTGKEITDWTELDADSFILIPVEGGQNAIQNSSNRSERKQLTVMTDQDLATQFRESVEWTVMNLHGSP